MTFTHKHHIIPKHMGGTDDPSNIIELSVEDHAKAHLELYEKYGNEYDRIAYESLMKRLPREEIVRQVCRATHLGKPKKPEAVEKMRRTKTGVPMSPESSEKKKKLCLKKLRKVGNQVYLTHLKQRNIIKRIVRDVRKLGMKEEEKNIYLVLPQKMVERSVVREQKKDGDNTG